MIKRISLLTILAVIPPLTGCTRYYIKPGASNQEFKRDVANCRAKVGAACGSSRYCPYSDYLDDCMAGEGWARGEAPPEPQKKTRNPGHLNADD